MRPVRPRRRRGKRAVGLCHVPAPRARARALRGELNLGRGARGRRGGPRPVLNPVAVHRGARRDDARVRAGDGVVGVGDEQVRRRDGGREGAGRGGSLDRDEARRHVGEGRVPGVLLQALLLGVHDRRRRVRLLAAVAAGHRERVHAERADRPEGVWTRGGVHARARAVRAAGRVPPGSPGRGYVQEAEPRRRGGDRGDRRDDRVHVRRGASAQPGCRRPRRRLRRDLQLRRRARRELQHLRRVPVPGNLRPEVMRRGRIRPA